MRNKLFKNITLGIACTLGLGGAIGASSGLFNQKDVEIKEAKAAPIEVSSLEELQTALSTATSSTEIIVTETIVLPNGTNLDGNGATVRVAEPYLTETGIINPNYKSNTVQNVFKVENTKSSSVSIRNMTVMGGYVEGDSWDAAIFNTANPYLYMENVTITRSCRGFDNRYGNAVLKNCNIIRNYATQGAGIGTCGNTILDGCNISENRITDNVEIYGVGIGGGGLELANGSVTYIINSVIANNTSAGTAAGISVYNAQLYMFNSTVTGNVSYNTNTDYTLAISGGIHTQLQYGHYNKGGKIVNSIIAENYTINRNDGTTNKRDMSVRNGEQFGQVNIDLYNCVYSSDPKCEGKYSHINLNNCKMITTDGNIANQYRNDGAISSRYDSSLKKYITERTSNYSHPIHENINSNKNTFNIPIKSDGGAASGGTNSYISYAMTPSSCAFNGGYGTDSNITKIVGSQPNAGDKITKYYDGSTRVAGVVGACSSASSGTKRVVTLDLDYANGTVSGATIYGDTHNINAAVTLTATPDTGYKFKKWTIEGASSVESTNNPYNLTVNEDKLVKVTFNKIYIVSFNANTGTGTVPESQSAATGETITLPNPTSLSKTGYTFNCWNTKANGTGTDYPVGSSYTIGTANATLYAKWSANQYTATLNDNGGEGGSGSVNVAYDASIPTVTVPTKDGYQFTGYYDDPDNGTLYIKADGTSAKSWDKTSNAILYAHWGLPIEASSTGFEGPYDGQAHSITLTVTEPVEGYTVMYRNGTSGNYNLTTLPTYTNAGSYTTGYKISKEGYADFYGLNTVVISKVPGTYVEPTAKEGLHYTGSKQTLINAGSTSHGSVRYRLGTSGNFVTNLPQATNVGSYDVYYKLVGDVNHTDSEVKYLTVTISANDKSALKNILDIANAFYNTYNSSYPDLLSSLKTVIDSSQAVYDNNNRTPAQIENAINALEEALNNARVDVTKDKINNLGTITYPDSKAKLDEARGLYDSIIDEKKPLVDNYKTLTDAEALYAQLELNATRHELDDDESGVKIETSDGIGIPRNIDLRVEVRTDVKAEEGSVAREKIEAMLEGRDKISGVYDVKLIQTIDGVEKEIQPSEIEEGLKIVVHITLPDDIDAESLKILHIHSEDDMEYLSDFKVENGELVFEVDRFSEFAFVTPGAGLPGWAVFLIVLGSLLGLCLLLFIFLFVLFYFYPRYIIDYRNKKVVRTIYVKKEHGMILLLDTHLRKLRRNEVDVYKTRIEAEKALNK